MRIVEPSNERKWSAQKRPPRERRHWGSHCIRERRGVVVGRPLMCPVSPLSILLPSLLHLQNEPRANTAGGKREGETEEGGSEVICVSKSTSSPSLTFFSHHGLFNTRHVPSPLSSPRDKNAMRHHIAVRSPSWRRKWNRCTATPYCYSTYNRRQRGCMAGLPP